MALQESVVVGRVRSTAVSTASSASPASMQWLPSPFGVGATGFFRIVQRVAKKEGWFRALVNDGTLLYPLYHADLSSAATALERFIRRHSQPLTVEQAADRIEGLATWLRRVAGKPKAVPARTPLTQPRPQRDVERDLEALRALFSEDPKSPLPDQELLVRLWATAPNVSQWFPSRRPH